MTNPNERSNPGNNSTIFSLADLKNFSIGPAFVMLKPSTNQYPSNKSMLPKEKIPFTSQDLEGEIKGCPHQGTFFLKKITRRQAKFTADARAPSGKIKREGSILYDASGFSGET
jgi:hypothetical protein